MAVVQHVSSSVGHARWVRVLHWIGAASVLTLAVTGFVILMAHPRLYWGPTGNDLTPALIELPISRNYQHGGWSEPEHFRALGRLDVVSAGRTYDIFNANGWGRSLHFLAGWFLVATGLTYLVMGFASGHFGRRLWPSRDERTSTAVAADVRAHLQLRVRRSPSTDAPVTHPGGPTYGPLQKLAYLLVVFVLAPGLVVTGMTMSPAITAAAPWLLTALNGIQSARTLHFVLTVTLVLFVVAHVVMVVATGASLSGRVGLVSRVGGPVGQVRQVGQVGISRRRWLAASVAGVAALVGYRARRFDLPRWSELPPTGGNPLRAGDTLTYAAQRATLSPDSLATEYTLADITAFPAVGTVNPLAHKDPSVIDAFQELSANQFANWTLQVEGAVARPREFSLAELKALPSRRQITRHTCEEGWSAIAQWTGVPLSTVLDTVGALPTARFVVFHAIDDIVDSLDMVDARHPQTIVAYGMNGGDLPVRHGAPLRLRVERQIGYKSIKYLTRIVVTEQFEDGGPKGDIQNGWSWYNGI